MSNKPFIIVVGTDFTPHSARALRIAYEHARQLAPAELHVVHASLAIAPTVAATQPALVGIGLPLKTLAEQRADLERHVRVELAPLVETGTKGVRIRHHVVLDEPSFALTHFAKALGADLLVVGTHRRRAAARWLFGSVSKAAMRNASCPVLIVPEPSDDSPGDLAPIAGNP